MSFIDRVLKHEGEPERAGKKTSAAAETPGMDPELEQALRSFRASVHSWSDAVYGRPRAIEAAPRRTIWRMAAAWTLGGVLVAGGTWGGFLEYQHRQEQDRLARLRQQQYQREMQEQKAREAEIELANVDRDVSQEVPDALEPLIPSISSDEAQ